MTIEPGFATKVPLTSCPVDDDVAAGREQVGNAALVHDGDGLRRRVLDVAEPEPEPARVRVARRLADDPADERDACPSARELAGRTDGVPPPAIEV